MAGGDGRLSHWAIAFVRILPFIWCGLTLSMSRAPQRHDYWDDWCVGSIRVFGGSRRRWNSTF